VPAPEGRNIYTAVDQNDGTLAMVPFTWTSLSATQQALLDVAPGARSVDGHGAQRLAYLRGDRSLEGTLFRRRSSVLGDSVHSTPVLVAKTSTRRAVIYLGANDGMLHAFDAMEGNELFAYIPDALISTLNRLPDPTYQHRAYVDGPASAGEAVIGGVRKTVLVSGMGGGAQGVFALDVSDPARFGESGVLWEFTDRDDSMIGNVTALPQIAKVRTRLSDGVGTYRYFAVVASGLNNYANDGHISSAGKGALFLLALDKPRDVAWQLNVNYYRLITPISDSSLANALSTPVLAGDASGALRYAYAGDLQGNLWRFDFSGNAPWSDAVGPGANKTPLFVARDADRRRQPISAQPLLAYASAGGFIVMFGTGRLIESADRARTSFAPQSYYAIIDSLRDPPELVFGRSELAERVVEGTTGASLLRISGDRMSADSKGWYVDFLEAETTGERAISSGMLASGEVLFNTLLPGADICDTQRSRSYVLNALTGLPDDSSMAYLVTPPVPIVGLLLNDYAPLPMLLVQAAVRTQADPVGRISVQKTLNVVNVTAQQPGRPVLAGRISLTRRAGRLSWREVANWRELHEATR
jgi:type IV pilus assembly protein PilY1